MGLQEAPHVGDNFQGSVLGLQSYTGTERSLVLRPRPQPGQSREHRATQHAALDLTPLV